jgi:hypothetical protein
VSVLSLINEKIVTIGVLLRHNEFLSSNMLATWFQTAIKKKSMTAEALEGGRVFNGRT